MKCEDKLNAKTEKNVHIFTNKLVQLCIFHIFYLKNIFVPFSCKYMYAILNKETILNGFIKSLTFLHHKK